MKRTVAIICLFLIVFSFSSCSKKVDVPDLSSCDTESAKSLLVNLGLVPVFENEYSDEIKAGLVVRSEPAYNEKVENGSKITVFVSLGASVDKAESWQGSYTKPFEYYNENSSYLMNIDNLTFDNDKIVFDISVVFGYHLDYSDTYMSGLYKFKFPSEVTAYLCGTSVKASLEGDAVDVYQANCNNGECINHRLKVTIPIELIDNKRPLEIVLDFPFYSSHYCMDYRYPEYASDTEESYSSKITLSNIIW